MAEKTRHRARTWLSKYWLAVTIIVCIVIVLVVAPLVYTFLSTRNQRYDLLSQPANMIPYHKVAIVFGAGILSNGQPTPYLSSRIATSAALYKAGRVRIILMSGDNSTRGHDEPTVMKKYAEKLGVPASAVVEDYAGYNTYDSCYRARHIFGVTNATLVSQEYHLPRAMVTCKGLGIQNIGVAATHTERDFTVNYILREFLSTDKMVFQLIFKPRPTVLGPPLPIR
ncbi:MAG TPA: ElyC/SanA/YdcF family protein [Candidatus Saccharimonadales bacterium]|nr:ElyC/SanA/YdcF family protein [Candidatus Saccharimonadales bacterium]